VGDQWGVPEGLRGFPDLDVVVRAFRTAVEGSSLRAVAAEVPCSPTNLSEFLEGSSAPAPRMANNYLTWFFRHGRGTAVRDVAVWMILRHVAAARRHELDRYLDSRTGVIREHVAPPAAAGDETSFWDRVRAALNQAAERTSVRQVAQAVEMSPTGLQEFIAGAEPRTKTRARLERWYAERRQRGDSDVSEALILAVGRLMEFVTEAERNEVLDVLRQVLAGSGIDLSHSGSA
jgi:hypothetical protein